MDKEAALLVVAKDLYLEYRKSAIVKAQAKTQEEALNNCAAEFLALYGKLKSGIEA